MKQLNKQFREMIRPGTLTLLAATALGLVLELLGLHSGFYLDPPQFWQGRIWTVLSYAFIPAGIVDFIFGGLWIFMIGSWLEKVWSPLELGTFCILSVLATGFFKVLVFLMIPAANSILFGAMPITFGLLMAWARLFGHERILFMGGGEMSVKQCAFLAAGINAVILLISPCFGLMNGLAVCVAALVGWFYLGWRWKRQLSAPGQTIETNRISRLEL
jgi:membrane associated rhomboid family serine protease